MIWVLRIFAGFVVLAYAAWLALPVVDTAWQAQSVAQAWTTLGGPSSRQGGVLAGLWIAVVMLYAVSGALTASGIAWAPGIYFLGFAGDILLRLALLGDQAAAPVLDVGVRTAEALRAAGLVLDAAPLSLGVLMAVGLCILALGVWRGQKGAALTRSWTEAPVWG